MWWSTNQIYYALSFTQAPVERDVYKRIPNGLDTVIDNEGEITVQENPNDYVLQLHINVYGRKVYGRV